MGAELNSCRLFFALWPDPGMRARLNDRVIPALEGLPGRRVPLENWHVTVAFLGTVSRACQACVEALAERVRCTAFTLNLDHYGYWARPQVVWLGASVCPAPLQNLVRDLGVGLHDWGVETDARPFAVHLTVLRKVEIRPRLPPSGVLAWTVDSLALVESRQLARGSGYHVIRDWPLRA